MKRGTVVCIGLSAVMVSACVMRSTYEAAVTELDATKVDLEKAKAEKEVLARQVRSLEEATQEATREAETTAAALQQSLEEAEIERKTGEERIAKLQRTMAQLTAAQHSLGNALEAAKQDTRALKSTVEMYKVKSGDGGPRLPSLNPPIAPPGEPADTGSASLPPAQTAAAFTSNQTATPPSGITVQPGTTADNTASQTSALPPATRSSNAADEGLFSAIKGWLMSLWRSVFS